MVLVWEDSGGNNIYTNFWGIRRGDTDDFDQFHKAIMQIGGNIFLVQKKNNTHVSIKNIKESTSHIAYDTLFNISFTALKSLKENHIYYNNFNLFKINTNAFELDLENVFNNNIKTKLGLK